MDFVRALMMLAEMTDWNWALLMLADMMVW
jgi:hypothetical protein